MSTSRRIQRGSTSRKATKAYIKERENLVLKNGLLYLKTHYSPGNEIVFHFVVLKTHQGMVLDGCHRDAAHQGQNRSLFLMQECFWWPGMTCYLNNHLKNCEHCRKFEDTPPIAELKPLPYSHPGEVFHIDFT